MKTSLSRKTSGFRRKLDYIIIEDKAKGYYKIASIYFMYFIYQKCGSKLLGYGYSLHGIYELLLFCLLLIISYALQIVERRTEVPDLFAFTIYTLSPFALFFIIDFWDYWNLWQIVIVFLLLAFFIYVVICINFRPTICEGRRKIRLIRKKRLLKTARYAGALSIMCSSILLIAFLVSPPKYEMKVISKTGTDDDVTPEKYDLSAFSEATWKKLSLQEKLEALSLVIEIENEDNGIPKDFVVSIKPEIMDNKNVLACYSDTYMGGEIRININHLTDDSAIYVLESVIHECEHCYQHRLCDSLSGIDEKLKTLRGIRDIENLRLEFVGYQSILNGASFSDYSSQMCEEDAQNRSNERIINFYIPIIYGNDSLYK